VYPTDRILSGGLSSPKRSSAGLSGQVELRSLRRNAHEGGNTRVGEPSMRRPRIPRLGAIPVLAPGSPVRPRGARKGLAETRRPRRSAGDSGKRLPARRSVAALASRRPGWRVHPQLRRWLCSVVRNRRVTVFAFVMTSAEGSDLSGGNVGEGRSGGSFVPVGSFAELGARRRYTLNARPEGMRGRLRWFTPSRPARGLKTAKIGKGHGGSTQPIRC
jgi:hypothetical protein